MNREDKKSNRVNPCFIGAAIFGDNEVEQDQNPQITGLKNGLPLHLGKISALALLAFVILGVMESDVFVSIAITCLLGSMFLSAAGFWVLIWCRLKHLQIFKPRLSLVLNGCVLFLNAILVSVIVALYRIFGDMDPGKF